MALAQNIEAAGGKRKRKRGGGAASSLGHGAGGERKSPPPPQKSAQKRGDGRSAPPSRPPLLGDIPGMIEDLRFNFNEPPGRAGIDPSAFDFESKRKMKRLFDHAHATLAKQEMAADELEFQRKMTFLRDQLIEKRKNISRLLGGASEEDCERNAPAPSIENGGSTNPSTEKGSQAENPYKEMILLLRDETPKLERAVDALLMHQRNQSIVEGHGDSTAFLGTRQQKWAVEEASVDVVSYDAPKIASECNESFKLASRIIQEGGEEIEIFEKYTNDDCHYGV